MTTITLPRAVVEQALEAMRCGVPTGRITLHEWDKALSDLVAALAQEPHRDIRVALQAPGCERLREWFEIGPVQRAALETFVDALAQEQAEPNHETRAELAEQQVVQLAEERDHYRNLWQKTRQAEPAQEPVAWCSSVEFIDALKYAQSFNSWRRKYPKTDMPLYTAPPQRKPLTEEDAAALIELDPRMLKEFGTAPSGAAMALIRRTERAHGIGG